jgi:hypothetical protein
MLLICNIEKLDLAPVLRKESMLVLAIISITAALAFYTIGAWAERKAQLLKP